MTKEESRRFINSLFRRENGIVYVVKEMRGEVTFDWLLVPVEIPEGLRARKTWKWDQAVLSQMTQIICE